MLIFAVGVATLILFQGSIANIAGDDLKNFVKYDQQFKKYAAQFGVDWQWLKAIAMNESNLGQEKSVAHGLLNPTDVINSASSDKKSWGLMQVTLTTAKELDPSASVEKLNNADYSIMLAAKYISKLMNQFSRSSPQFTEWVIKSYNQGPGNTRKEILTGKGYADTYWDRFKNNLKQVQGSK